MEFLKICHVTQNYEAVWIKCAESSKFNKQKKLDFAYWFRTHIIQELEDND